MRPVLEYASPCSILALGIHTKTGVTQIFNFTYVLPILLYGSEAWTLLQEYLWKLEAFNMRCQRMMLGICWHDFIRYT